MLETGPPVRATLVAPKARTVGDVLRLRAEASGHQPAVYAKEGGDTWVKTTWSEFYAEATRVAKGLIDLGLEPGDRVAILGPTKKPWGFYDFGCQLAGLISLGIYPKQSPEQIRYLLEHAEARVLFVDGADELEAVLAAADGNRHLLAIVPWSEAEFEDFKARDERIRPASAFRGERLPEERVEAIQATLDPDETAILVYTSGTTGPPKGAMISHANILAVLSVQDEFLDVREDDSTLAFLPMAHVAERVLGFYGRVNAGYCGAYASSIGTVLQELGEVRPTIFGSVPRIFEKAHASVRGQIDKKSGLVRRLVEWAVRVGHKRIPYLLEGKRVPIGLALRYALADRILFRKVRAAFGGAVRMAVVGAAPTPRPILEFFWAAGLPLYEVYGMTEATVLTHCNRSGAVRLGTVGRLIEPMEHRIADDGEILVRGPFVFKGYFKNPEATAETIRDGWLYTGDVGAVDDAGYLRITDRKKHLIITAGGKNLTPANIENAIKSHSPLIHQVHAHGDGRPYISAVVAPSPIETLEFGVERGLIDPGELEERTQELLANPAGRSEALNRATSRIVTLPEFRELILRAVRRGNEELAQVERVRRFHILERDFSQEAGELTPTMKVKRKTVEQEYAHVFDRIYDEDGFAINT